MINENYEAPQVEVIEVEVEKGFTTSNYLYKAFKKRNMLLTSKISLYTTA